MTHDSCHFRNGCKSSECYRLTRVGGSSGRRRGLYWGQGKCHLPLFLSLPLPGYQGIQRQQSPLGCITVSKTTSQNHRNRLSSTADDRIAIQGGCLSIIRWKMMIAPTNPIASSNCPLRAGPANSYHNTGDSPAKLLNQRACSRHADM